MKKYSLILSLCILFINFLNSNAIDTNAINTINIDGSISPLYSTPPTPAAISNDACGVITLGRCQVLPSGGCPSSTRRYKIFQGYTSPINPGTSIAGRVHDNVNLIDCCCSEPPQEGFCGPSGSIWRDSNIYYCSSTLSGCCGNTICCEKRDACLITNDDIRCCPSGFKACGNACIRDNATCCSGGTNSCPGEAPVCCSDTTGCCPINTRCCGSDACCPISTTCQVDSDGRGTCIYNDSGGPTQYCQDGNCTLDPRL